MSLKNEANNPGLPFDNLLVDPLSNEHPAAASSKERKDGSTDRSGGDRSENILSLSSVFGLVVAIAMAWGFI